MAVVIADVEKRSPASRARIKAGDTLVSINGREIEDVLDYRFYMPDSRLTVTVQTPKGKCRTLTVRKKPYAELGLVFDTYLMDKQRSCRNNCIFCFIDQLPEGMRDSLYFKDDDSRLSFLFGNYITLTNLTERDVERIIEMHISPINVSVHTTNPDLRCRMMHNRFAGDCLRHLYRFAEAGLDINCQLVLVPGYNDGAELARSMEDLAALAPAVRSVAAVPVGLTKHREGLPRLRSFTAEESAAVIDAMTAMGDQMREKHGTRVFYPSDEWYIKAGRPIPDAEFYEEYLQLENGVGMIALLREEFKQAAEEYPLFIETDRLVIATGVDAAPYLQELADYAMQRWPAVQLQVVPIKNEFFGESITVSGLVTGGDLIKQLQGVPMDRLLLPANMLRQEGDLFLDDVSVEQVEEALGVPVTFIQETDGVALFEALFDIEDRKGVDG
ncbi:MAG: DUF512 domain-containing protein [Clostridia bacterium]|nr:DUF512 domain-containing protein [Clostridia bacterium]